MVIIYAHKVLKSCVLASNSYIATWIWKNNTLIILAGNVLTIRNAAVYDEVVLPLSTSSSAIPTEPNAAYVSSTRTSH